MKAVLRCAYRYAEQLPWAVIHNPFAGAYVEEIAAFMDDLKPLGLDMAKVRW